MDKHHKPSGGWENQVLVLHIQYEIIFINLEMKTCTYLWKYENMNYRGSTFMMAVSSEEGGRHLGP